MIVLEFKGLFLFANEQVCDTDWLPPPTHLPDQMQEKHRTQTHSHNVLIEHWQQCDLMWKELQMLWGAASLHRIPQLQSAGLGLRDERENI